MPSSPPPFVWNEHEFFLCQCGLECGDAARYIVREIQKLVVSGKASESQEIIQPRDITDASLRI